MKIIVDKPRHEININELSGKEIILYKSRGGHICVLSGFLKKIDTIKTFGFKNLAYTDSDITYRGDSMYESIRAALYAGKTVIAFDSYDEFITAVANKKI